MDNGSLLSLLHAKVNRNALPREKCNEAYNKRETQKCLMRRVIQQVMTSTQNIREKEISPAT